VLVDVTDIAGDYPNTSYVTSRSFLKKPAGGVKKFLHGDGDGGTRIQANPSIAIPLTQKFLEVKDPATPRRLRGL
jgi:hypothetical protein